MGTVRKVDAADSHQLRRSILILVGTALCSLALLVLYGWAVDNSLFKSIVHGFTPMNPVTAVCFGLLGVSLGLFGILGRSHRFTKSVAGLSSIVMTMIGLLMALHYLTSYDAQVDRLLFHSSLGINRMAPSTAACLILSGSGLWLIVLTKKLVPLARILLMGIIFIATYTLVSYAYGLQPVYGVASLNPMALHTALIFILAAGALICATIENFTLYISVPLLAIYSVSIGLFMSLSVFSFRSFTQLGSNNVTIQRYYMQQRTIDDLRTALIDAETGQRGYLLTGNRSYLEPYNSALLRVGTSLTAVEKLPHTVISPAAAAMLDQLARAKLEELKSTIDLKDRSGTAAATALVTTDQGKHFMDQIRAILARSNNNVTELLRQSSDQALIQNDQSLLLLSVSTATILSLLLASLYFLQDNLKRQHELALHAEADRQTTLKENHQLAAEVSDRLRELERVKNSLEAEVIKRTADLQTELARTTQLNSFMIDRELRIKALKDEIEDLKKKPK